VPLAFPPIFLRRAKVQQESLLLVPEQVLQALLSWQDSRGVTPLMLAARNGHAECLELLLAQGANPLLLDTVNDRCGAR
jgi:ankyrin repeat protein